MRIDSPSTDIDPKLAFRFRSFSQVAAGLSILVGALALIGWATHVWRLTAIWPGQAAMKANTALAIVLAGASLLLLRDAASARARRLGQTCALLVASLGLVTLLEYMLGWNAGIDELLFAEKPSAIDTTHPSRMFPATALGLVLVSTSLLLVGERRRFAHEAAEVPACVAGTIASLAFLGYIYGAEALYRVSDAAMAFQTAIVLMALAAGVLASRPEVGLMAILAGRGTGSSSARRILPPALILFPIVAWLWLEGQRRGIFDFEFGLALLVVTGLLTLTWGILDAARSLNRADAERKQAEAEASRQEIELQAERARQEGEQRLKTVVETMTDGLVVVDSEGTIVLWNKAAEQILGMPMAHVHLSEVSEQYGVFLADGVTPLSKDERSLMQTVRDVHITKETEFFVRNAKRPEGVWLSVSAAPLGADDGSLNGGVVVLRDITERKRMQQETDRLRDEFLGLVSHDLRTPLTSIKGYLELLLEGEGGKLSERGEYFLEVVARNASRLERLVNDLVFVAQVESGEFAIEREAVDLDEIASRSVEAARPNAEGRGVVLGLNPALHGECLGDRDRLAQLLDNLISNGIKHTPEGGSVEVKLRNEGEHMLLEVRDTGVGIPEGEQRRIFDRFFRASSATKRGIKGVGLGLTIVKAIAEGHGARLSVESKEGAGTTVRLEIPLPESMRKPEAVVGGKEKALGREAA
ncbi:MAG: ATP-binding protein [Solirubrobacterales bacterium]